MNIKKLEDLYMLGDIRQRLGADDENDSSCDDKIIAMDARTATSAYVGWSLGNDEYGNDTIDKYTALKLSEVASVKKELEEELISSSVYGKVSLDDAFNALDALLSSLKREED